MTGSNSAKISTVEKQIEIISLVHVSINFLDGGEG